MKGKQRKNTTIQVRNYKGITIKTKYYFKKN